MLTEVDIGPLERANLTRDTKPDQAIQCHDRSHRSIGAEVEDSLHCPRRDVIEPLWVGGHSRRDTDKRVLADPLTLYAVPEDLATNTDPSPYSVSVQVRSLLFPLIAFEEQPLAKQLCFYRCDRLNFAILTKPQRKHSPRLSVCRLG
ncbi:hypothetical protein [Rhodopirellula europaea]|uniref:hypothetical protein n=1 Tax=Rhodopirellula europaea TaxID=1263866 RepID=UPI003D280783